MPVQLCDDVRQESSVVASTPPRQPSSTPSARGVPCLLPVSPGRQEADDHHSLTTTPHDQAAHHHHLPRCRFISCFRASRPREASYSDSRLHTSASFVTVRVSKCRMRTCPRAALPETRSCPPAHWTHPPDRQGSAESYLHYASSVAHRASDSFPLSSRPVSSLPAGFFGEDTCANHGAVGRTRIPPSTKAGWRSGV